MLQRIRTDLQQKNYYKKPRNYYGQDHSTVLGLYVEEFREPPKHPAHLEWLAMKTGMDESKIKMSLSQRRAQRLPSTPTKEGVEQADELELYIQDTSREELVERLQLRGVTKEQIRRVLSGEEAITVGLIDMEDSSCALSQVIATLQRPGFSHGILAGKNEIAMKRLQKRQEHQEKILALENRVSWIEALITNSVWKFPTPRLDREVQTLKVAITKHRALAQPPNVDAKAPARNAKFVRECLALLAQSRGESHSPRVSRDLAAKAAATALCVVPQPGDAVHLHAAPVMGLDDTASLFEPSLFEPFEPSEPFAAFVMGKNSSESPAMPWHQVGQPLTGVHGTRHIVETATTRMCRLVESLRRKALVRRSLPHGLAE